MAACELQCLKSSASPQAVLSKAHSDTIEQQALYLCVFATADDETLITTTKTRADDKASLNLDGEEREGCREDPRQRVKCETSARLETSAILSHPLGRLDVESRKHAIGFLPFSNKPLEHVPAQGH